MTRYLLRALGSGLFIIWGAVTLVFIIVRMVPGDQATILLGPDATTEEVEALREELGLNAPLPVQYGLYLLKVVQLDFGDSYRFGQPALELVMSRLPATIELTLAATAIALLGLVLGALAGSRPGSLRDRGISGLALTLQAMPTFWVGIMLILLFSLELQVLPSSGTGSWAHLVLPAVTLAAPFIALLTRITRSSVVETMSEGYVQTARSKGLSERRVLTGHVMRNSSIPIVTIFGLQVGALLGGAVIVENVFAWPGLGTLLVSAVSNRDYAIVQAGTLVAATIVVVLNLTVDLLYAQLDPRIRLVRS
ncbi:ABC transporter permease [Microbacterium sp. I2]|uniref:ABC transporter permease n=1 Tax=Microbacterium sp. I2 TaxID=3391826 RepID=UPI003ED9424C